MKLLIFSKFCILLSRNQLIRILRISFFQFQRYFQKSQRIQRNTLHRSVSVKYCSFPVKSIVLWNVRFVSKNRTAKATAAGDMRKISAGEARAVNVSLFCLLATTKLRAFTDDLFQRPLARRHELLSANSNEIQEARRACKLLAVTRTNARPAFGRMLGKFMEWIPSSEALWVFLYVLNVF